MANITRTFTFNLPDEYTKQTSDLGLTAEWTYEGPAYMWVFVDASTGELLVSQSFIPSKGGDDKGEEARTRAGLDERAILLAPGSNDLDATIASLYIGKDTGASAGYPQKDYAFPAGHPNAGEVYYSRPDPQQPNHTYAAEEVTYSFDNDSWVTPLPWFKPWMTLEFHQSARDTALEGARGRLEDYRGNMTADQITAAEAYIAEMEAIYTKYDGIDPHMIGFPTDPTAELVEDYDYNEDPDGLLASE